MYDLLEILADGEFHSGAQIGVELGITRAAVWKRMQKLQQQADYEIESVSGKGYRLKEGVELLDIKKVQELSGPEFGVVLLKTVDSTNEYAKRLVRNHQWLDVVLAEEQTQGRGRRGRQWQSPYASNLYASFVWPVTEGMRQLEGLSLAVGLAVLQAIDDLGVEDAGLKWPNDILVGEEKIAGVLLELIGDLADQSHVIIGVGINVNMQRPVEEIGQPWTSLRHQLGGYVSRHDVYRGLLGHLRRILSVQKLEGFAALRQQWDARHLWRGRSVELSSGVGLVKGQVTGINDRGELGIRTSRGEEFFAGGELSLRLANDS